MWMGNSLRLRFSKKKFLLIFIKKYNIIYIENKKDIKSTNSNFDLVLGEPDVASSSLVMWITYSSIGRAP